MTEQRGWMAGDEDMPEVVKRWMSEPDPGDPPYDYRRIEILFDTLIHLPPRDFAGFRDLALDGHEHEWNAAQGMAVAYINDQLATHPPGSREFLDAAARADELQRLTIGD